MTKPFKEWDVQKVQQWLSTDWGLSEEILKKFRDGDVVGDRLLDLNDFQLIAYGVNLPGVRRGILNELKSTVSVDSSGHVSKRVKTTTGAQEKGLDAPEMLKFEKNPLFELTRAYLDDTGLAERQKLVLFCRPTFLKQFEFLQRVLDYQKPNVEIIGENPHVSGWIMGPPGTGKSTTTLAFISTIDRQTWTTTWVHLSSSFSSQCIQMVGSKKHIHKLEDPVNALKPILAQANADRKHIVFIDGFTTNPEHQKIKIMCNSWLMEDYTKRRVVFASSLPTRGKISTEDDILLGVEEFYVQSWNREEYTEAMNNTDFFEAIKGRLDASEDSGNTPSKSDLLESKLYFAGGSARFMFNYSTAKVVKELKTSTSSVDDVLKYLQNSIGDQSKHVINRLFGCRVDHRGTKTVSIVSQFAGSLLAMKGGPDFLRNLAIIWGHQSNPSMQGHMFEMWFFASLTKGGIEYYFNKKGRKALTWPESPVEILGEHDDFSEFEQNGVWLKPIKWNQGGYDAVYVSFDKKLVRFVQVTRAHKHSFKIAYFHAFMKRLLGKPNYVTDTLEVFFLVPKSELETFQISKVEGEGLLAAFEGWEKGKEKDAVKIVGVDWCEA